jgi:acetyl esterase/lipase
MNVIQLSVGKNSVPLTGYLHSYNSLNTQRNFRPSIVLCPGGAYRFTAEVEKDPVASYFFGIGFNVFTLEYSCEENAKDLNPLLELSESLVKIRDHAIDFRCDPTKVAVMGFSAGGHLAASLAILYSNSQFQAASGIRDGYNSPDALILGYPVITTGEFKHKESIDNVTGGRKDLIKLLSLEKQVKEDCPPVFLWTTQTDEAVSVQNSLLLVNALVEKNISVEFHLFPEGKHGLSMCNKECDRNNESVSQWKRLCVNWLEKLFDFQFA